MPELSAGRVYIVDDDPACCDSLSLLLELKGFECIACTSGVSFIDAYREAPPSCVLLDFKMPEMSGLEVQREMARRGWNTPVIMLSAHGDVSTTRNALKSGAVDFLEKPVDADQLLTAVEVALARARHASALEATRKKLAERMGRLTTREAEVMRLVVEGLHNREIAASLGISARTVEVYKARLMLKLEVSRTVDLVKLLSQGAAESENGHSSS